MCYGKTNEKEAVVMDIYDKVPTKTIRTFATGATRDTDTDKPDYRGFCSPAALKRFGQYMTEHQKQSDGGLRASDNWKKGIPPVEYMSSLLRHVIDLWDGFERFGYAFDSVASTKEWQDLLCAIIFNSQGLLHETMKQVRYLQAERSIEKFFVKTGERFNP